MTPEDRLVWDEAALARVHQVPDKARRVQAMFDAIVPRYELVNRLTTLGLDGTWRRRLVRGLQLPQGARVLDIACGTGQVVRAFQRYRREVESVCGLDFSGEMVREAKRVQELQRTQALSYSQGHGPGPQQTTLRPQDRGTRHSCASGASTPSSRREFVCDPCSLSREQGVAPGTQRSASYLQGDAQHLPFGEKSFDAVTCVFGVRNFAEPGKGLGEMLRVLRPGGMVGILEFSMPRVAVLAGLYRAYFRFVLPRLASWLSGDRGGAYRYLQKSVEAFSQEVDLREQLRQCGFTQVQVRPLTFGVVCLYTAVRPMGEQG